MGIDGTKTLRKRLSALSSVLAGMTPPFPALEILREDVTSAQDWLDKTLIQISEVELSSSPSGRPPDEKKRRKEAERIKTLVKDFLKRSFETDELLGHSHAWLDQDNYKDTTFDLDIARLEYSWSQVRDKLAELASEYQCSDLQSELARDLSAQGGDGFSPSQSVSTPRSRLATRRTTNPDATQGHQPKHKQRKYVPHLSWQYRAVIKSNVKFRDRTPRGSILGSEPPSECGSLYNEPLFTIKPSLKSQQGSHSSSSLSLPTVVGAGASRYGDGSASSLPTLSDADRKPLFSPGYRDGSDSLVSRDLDSNTVRVKQRIQAIRARKQQREPSNQLSLVRYASDSSGDTKEFYVDLSSPGEVDQRLRDLSSPGEVDKRLRNLERRLKEEEDSIITMEDFTRVKENGVPASEILTDPTASPYPVKSKFSRLTRSSGIHEGLTSLTKPGSNHSSGRSTPTRSTRSRPNNQQTPVSSLAAASRYPLTPDVLVSTPGARAFLPSDVSTPVLGAAAGVPRCPQTPVEIRKFLGTNNSGAGRLSPDGSYTADFSDTSGSSNVSSLTQSPTEKSHRDIRRDLKRKYQKDELWRAIKSDYHYLMDEDIIEQCRSTDSDLSWDDEEVKNAVTFTDFIQQYNELMEWLNNIQMFTQRQGSSLSEKYLNQSYYEEMLDRSPRRKLFNDYAKQLMRRYPNMRDEITVRLTHLNNQWERLQRTVAPAEGLQDRQTMLRDLALDLQGLETWVNRIEATLQSRSLNPSLSLQQLQDMLKEHQELQQDVECHSKVVSAVLKLCERLHKDDESVTSLSEELQITALNLERRWHSIWLQSLEWQCRLEEAVSSRTNLLGRSLSETHIRRLNDTSYDQSDSRLEVTSDESESGIQNDQSSQFSEASNAQTVTHDRATSPGTSTLGRQKGHHANNKHSTHYSESQSTRRPLETDQSQHYLELPDPDTHILIAEDEDELLHTAQGDSSNNSYNNQVCRPAEGKVRHWSEDQPRTGAHVDRQYSTERKRRYSDSAHITVDSPTTEFSPTLRSKSLDDLRKLFPGVKSNSSGSLDGLSDDSDDLFDETEALLKSVASELRTYESFDDDIDDDDEFFIYNKCEPIRGSQGLLSQFTTAESGLESVIEEEPSEGESDENMSSSSPRRKIYSPGERVFASPKVKRFLQLQSFSNTVSPSTTPPSGGKSRRDSNLESDAESLVEEGDLVLLDGKLVVDNNASLTKDLQSTVPREALPLLTATRLKHYSHPQNPSDITDCDLSNNNAIKEGTVSPSITLSPKSTAERTLYRLEEYNTKLDIQLRKGLDEQPPHEQFQLDNILLDDSAEEDYYYESSGGSSPYTAKGAGLGYLNRYSNREDLSQLVCDDSPANESDPDSNLATVSRLSLSPSDLPCNFDSRMERRESDDNDNLLSVMTGSSDFGYMSGGTQYTEHDPVTASVKQGPTHSSSVVVDISVPSSPRQQKHRLVEKTHKITQLSNKPSDNTPEIQFNFFSSTTPSVAGSEHELVTVSNSKPTAMVVNVQSSVKSPDGASPVTDVNVQQLILESLQQSSESDDLANESTNSFVSHSGPKSIIISGLPSEVTTEIPPGKVRKIEISSKSSLVDPQFISNATIIPKLGPSTPLSPASMISKGGFTLKQHITEQGDQLYPSHMTLNGKHSTGSIILSPIMHHSEQLSPENYSQSLQINTTQQNKTTVIRDFDRRTQSLSASPAASPAADDDSPEYSVLQGRITRSESIPHEHGSCDNRLRNYAIWETEVGLPANWSSINVPSSSHSQSGVVHTLGQEKATLSRQSSETYSTGYITPSRSYLKVTSVPDEHEKADGEEFSETIYINPSEVTKSAIEATTEPSDTFSATESGVIPADTEESGSENEEITPNIVTGIETVTATIRPATKPRVNVQLVPSVEHTSGISEIRSVSVRPGRSNLTSDETPTHPEHYQDHEFTTVTPHRPDTAEDVTTDEERHAADKDRFTSEANLLFIPGHHIPYSENTAAGTKFVGSHRNSSNSTPSDEEESPTTPPTRVNKKTVVLSRKSLPSRENETPEATKLEFSTISIDNSGEAADIDLESRRQKAGTVYRILDNGLVVCESHPEITDDLIPQSPSDSDESGEDNSISGSTHPSSEPSFSSVIPEEELTPPSINIDNTDTASLSGNDLSPLPKNAIELINKVLPDSPKELSVTDSLELTIPDITVTNPSPIPELDFGDEEEEKPELRIPDITVTSPSPRPDDNQQQITEKLPTDDVTRQPDDVTSPPDITVTSPSQLPDDNQPQITEQLPTDDVTGKPDDVTSRTDDVTSQPDDVTSPLKDTSSGKPLSAAEKLLAELDSIEGPEDATAAESLFDLITGMNPPGEVEEITPTDGPEVPKIPEIILTIADDEVNVGEENKENWSDDSSHPDVCDSPLPSDESPDDVYDSRLEDFLSSGVEELPASDEADSIGGDVFRPISGDSEYDSEVNTHDHDADDTFSVTEIVRPEAQKAERSPELIEPLVSTLLTPLEMCAEEAIVPQHHRNRFRDIVRDERQTAVGEEVSPLELTEDGLKQYLDSSLNASPVPDSDPHPRRKLALEEEIVPTDQLNVEEPNLSLEPNLEVPTMHQQPLVYSDTEDLNVDETDAISAISPTLADKSETMDLFESPAQSLLHSHENNPALPTNDDAITNDDNVPSSPAQITELPDTNAGSDIVNEDEMPPQLSESTTSPAGPELDTQQLVQKEDPPRNPEQPAEKLDDDEVTPTQEKSDSGMHVDEPLAGDSTDSMPAQTFTGPTAPTSKSPTTADGGEQSEDNADDDEEPTTSAINNTAEEEQAKQTTDHSTPIVDSPATSDSAGRQQPPPLEKNASVVSVGGPVDDNSDAFDGDESSEGEEAESVWPHVSQADEPFERESSVDTVRHKVSSDSVKESSPDQQPVRATPTKKRRKRRPRTLTGSPKLHDNEESPEQSDSPIIDTLQQSHDMPLTNQLSDDLSSANQMSDDLSHDLSAEDELSDIVSSDNDELITSGGGMSEGSNWDYYQDPPYSTGTEPEFDIDLEPKLDDSVLQWDDELDEENDTISAIEVGPMLPTGAVGGASAHSDSEDSDIEDLHYVIQQSSTQLLQADSALRKPRRDVVQCGIYLDPQKYIEWHATCQTNIKCLQVIQEHLESEQGLANLTDDDIQQVLDLIKKWQSLEKLALERKEQSTTLCKIYRDILAGKKSVNTCEEELSTPAFNNVSELENHFRTLQTFRANTQSQAHKLQQINDAVLVFEADNKKIKMAGFKQLIGELSTSSKPTSHLMLSIGKKTTELQYAIVHWHKWNTDCKDLESSLIKTSYDIEPVELAQCEQRLVELEASFSEYSSVCTDAAHNYTEEKLASLRRRLNHLMSDKQPSDPSVQEPVPALQLEDNLSALPADGSEVGSDPDATLTRDRAKKNKNKGRKHPWALEDQEDNESNMSSQASPGSIEISPEKTDPFKSSMESGFATMDTERSNQGGSTDGDLPSGSQREPETSSPVERKVTDRPEFEPSDDQSAADSLLLPAEGFGDSSDNVPPVDKSQPAETESFTMQPLVDDSSIQPETENFPTLSQPMEPLTVDVDGHDTGTSDHQTPPTVEDLAPSLPITDQEKINVAKRSKKNKRNKKKKKGAAATDANQGPDSRAQQLPPSDSQSIDQQEPVVLEQLKFKPPSTHDMSTSTDMISLKSVELQTVNSPLLADSSTNTELDSQSQSDPRADQHNMSSPAALQDQSAATNSQSTSDTANQTGSIPTSDDFTGMVPGLSIEQQTDLSGLPELSDDKSTNTPRKTDSESQTTLTSSPKSSPRSKHPLSLYDKEAQTDDTDQAGSGGPEANPSTFADQDVPDAVVDLGGQNPKTSEVDEFKTPDASGSTPESNSDAASSTIPKDSQPSSPSAEASKSPGKADNTKSPTTSAPSSTKKKDKKRRKKGKAKYEAILREPTPVNDLVEDESSVPADNDDITSSPVSTSPDLANKHRGGQQQAARLSHKWSGPVRGDLPTIQPFEEPEIAAVRDTDEAQPANQTQVTDEPESERTVGVHKEDSVKSFGDNKVPQQPGLNNQAQIHPMGDEQAPDQPITDAAVVVDNEFVPVPEPAVDRQRDMRNRKKNKKKAISDEMESKQPAVDEDESILRHSGETVTEHVEEASAAVVDDEVVPVTEPAVDRQRELRQRKKNKKTAAVAEVEALPLAEVKTDSETSAATEKTPPRSSWFSSARSLTRYMGAVVGSLLFLLFLLFLLEPKCCENTRYHRGIFGLRRHYTDLPPH